jgi:hypothetical protein
MQYLLPFILDAYDGSMLPGYQDLEDIMAIAQKCEVESGPAQGYAKGLYKYYTELELEESSVCDQSNLREGNKIHNKLAIHVSPNPTSSLIHVYTPQDGNL